MDRQLSLFDEPPRITGGEAYETLMARLNPTVREDDEPRLGAAQRRLLEYLSDHGWHTNVALVGVAGVRYGARIEELRKAGYPIAKEHVHEGIWKYRLLDREEG